MLDYSPLTRPFQTALLDWYTVYGRELPWRQTTDPYQIMVSEIMLQQTQVDRVIPKYFDWLKDFPTIKSLSEASVAELLQHWAGLGYNRRALYLQKAAQKIMEIGQFPSVLEQLQALPGIGPYTAAAICSFAYNQNIALVDTNVKRIYQLLVFGDIVEPKLSELNKLAMVFLPKGRSREWHNALMDLGSVVAKERGARAQQHKLIELLPVLKNHELPTLTDHPLRRPKQSHFKQSRRYWRGRIIALLQKGPFTNKELGQELNQLGDSPYPLDELLSALEKEGFIELTNAKISLQGHNSSTKR